MAETRYKSIHTGAKIDEAVSRLLSGELSTYASQAATSANTSKAWANQAAASAAAAQTSATQSATSAGQSANSADESKGWANVAQQYSGKPPQAIRGTWWVWNAGKQKYEDTGVSAVLTINHTYPSVAAMQADFPNTDKNDMAAIQGDVEIGSTAQLYINDGTKWVFLTDLSGIQGPQGAQGPTGATGPQGNVGPAGPQGVQGPPGPEGPRGINGVAVATENLFAFNVLGDDLYLYYADGDNPPDFEIGLDGHLYLTLPSEDDENANVIDLGKVAGPQGVQGIQGPPGPQGETGPQGPEGAAGPQGPEGPRGINGVAVAASGIFAFNVDVYGDLILSYTDADHPPSARIGNDGNLYFTV